MNEVAGCATLVVTMRVIAGTAKGIHLVAPKGLDVRPTLDRVREALFSILGPDIEGARFLDLYAGTGANGIEALSRGAATAVFVENDPRSIAAIEANLKAAKVQTRAEIKRISIPTGLRTLSGRKFEYIFADPPYVAPDYSILLKAVRDNDLLVPQGILVIEHSARTKLDQNSAPWMPYRRADYGETALSFFS